MKTIGDKLNEIAHRKVRIAIGLMSGTSADGVSAVLVKISGSWIETKFKIIEHETYPYPKELRKRIFELFNPETSTVDKICVMNFILGKVFAEAARKIAEKAGLKLSEIDFIASHGQTIHHIPREFEVAGYKTRSTLQIGEPSIIAAETGVLTIADFRPKDIAVGGEGAPISAYVDYIIFRSNDKSRAVQNIGGIANVTYIPRKAEINDIIAFDTGPGNSLIDAVVKHVTKGKLSYDINGEIAAKGRVNNELLNWLLEHPYYKRKPPKTTGREEFGEKYALRIIEKARKLGIEDQDLIATVTMLTAKTIAESYKTFLPEIPEEIIIGGGGAYNRTLIEMLKRELKGIKILLHEDFGIPSQAKEPLVMVILGNEVLNLHFNNIPRATGASRTAVLGKIVLPN